jgi:hypothetical protein
VEQLAPPPEQAQEAIAWGKVLGIGIGSLVVFAVATLITARMLHAREKALQPMGPDPIPQQIGQAEIGIVDQAPFDVSRVLQTYRDERLSRLSSWGWVDRKAGVVHMPIEEAMDRVVKEHRK